MPIPDPQTDLFDVGERLHVPKPKETCTAAPIGTGPKGETCKTCKHYVRAHYRGKVYLKCGLMRHAWTHGAATDIKAKWAACRYWEADDAQT